MLIDLKVIIGVYVLSKTKRSKDYKCDDFDNL